MKWISCDDRIPEVSGIYLVCKEERVNRRQTIHVEWWDVEREPRLYVDNYWASLHGLYRKITHWMPLPELPELSALKLEETA